jgi:hypothetical protein
MFKVLHFIAWYIALHLVLFLGIFLVVKLMRHARKQDTLQLPDPTYSAVS